MQPHRRHDKEQLDAHCAEGQDPTKRDAESGVGVPHLVWDMARDLVRAHGHLDSLLLEPELAAYKDQRSGDAEPQ